MIELQRVYEHRRTRGPRLWPRGIRKESLHSSHDTGHNNTVVLRDYVSEKLDQPANEPANAASGHGGHSRDR